MTFVTNINFKPMKVDERLSIAELNDIFRPLQPEQRITELYRHFTTNDVMLTSSFAATSAYLLHLFSVYQPEQEVLFIDTGYHFEETLIYKEYLTKVYGLKTREVRAETWKHEFTTKDETWTKDPDYCCTINKVEPLEKLKEEHEIWVSGLMSCSIVGAKSAPPSSLTPLQPVSFIIRLALSKACSGLPS